MILDLLAGLLIDLVHQLESPVDLLDLFTAQFAREKPEKQTFDFSDRRHVCPPWKKRRVEGSPRGVAEGG
jgi:hypothetical protein